MEIYCDCPECTAIRECWTDEELADEMAFMALLEDLWGAEDG